MYVCPDLTGNPIVVVGELPNCILSVTKCADGNLTDDAANDGVNVVPNTMSTAIGLAFHFLFIMTPLESSTLYCETIIYRPYCDSSCVTMVFSRTNLK